MHDVAFMAYVVDVISVASDWTPFKRSGMARFTGRDVRFPHAAAYCGKQHHTIVGGFEGVVMV